MSKQRPYQNWFIVSLCFFLVALAVTVMMYKIPTIMTQIMALLDVSAGIVSWFMSIYTFTGIFFAVFSGFLIKRFGPRKVVLGASVLDVVASLAGAAAPMVGGACVPLLIITRGLEGIAFVCVIASVPVMIQQCIDPKRIGTSTGFYMLGGMLGAMIGGIITPTLFFSVGFSGLWIANAVFMAVCALIFAVVVKFPTAEELAARMGDAAPAEGAAEEKIDYKVFVQPKLLLFFLGFAVFQFLLLAVLTYAPTALQQRGMDATLSGFVSTLPQLISIVTSLAFGAIADATHRNKPLFIIGMLAMAVCAPLALVTDVPLLWVVLVVMGLLAMGVPTVAMAAYPQVLGNPKYLTVGMGIMMLVQSLGQFFGSSIPAVLLGADLTNWMLLAIVMCVAGLVATVCIILSKFK